MNIYMQFFEWTCVFYSPGWIPWRGIAGLYGKIMFKFLIKCQTVFLKWLYCFTFLPALYKDFIFSTSLPTLVIVCLFVYGYARVGIKWSLLMGLFWISLMTNVIEHHFIILVSSSISSLEKCLLRSCAHLLIGLFIILFSFKNTSLGMLNSSPSDIFL